MSMSNHVQELRKKHTALSSKVEEVQRSPSSNDSEIRALKREKLRIKEEITRLTH